MSAAYLIRYFVFLVMSVMVGIFSSFSASAAVSAAVMAFGYGVAEICEAIADRKPS